MRVLPLLFILLCPLILSACNDDQQASAPLSPPEVDVIAPLKKEVTLWDEYTGRFQAVEEVDLRARVSGYLDQINFKDGEIVRKGDTLFVIDPRPFEFELKRVEAQYSLAQKEFKRAEGLRKTRAISQEDFDRRLQELKVAEAALDDAKLNLDFTTIKAPFDGRVSDAFLDKGNLVRANDTVLTTIVSLNPIHFEFDASQADFLRYTRLDRSGQRNASSENPNPLFVKLQDEDKFNHAGFMDFVDNRVDQATGTIRGRALVGNDDLIIYPGLFGRARLLGAPNTEYILLPERTINTDQDRKFVYTVNADNQAVRSYVEVGQILDNGFVIIEDGLQGDERVVIMGMQRIRAPQQPVTPNVVDAGWTEIDTMPDPESITLTKPVRSSREEPQNNGSDEAPTNENEEQ